MNKSFRRRSALRAIGVISAALIVVSGVTYAALQSQQIKISGNTIQTATANLMISPDGNNYTSGTSGFVFSNLIPGGQAMPLNGYTFHLKNGGGTPLVLKFAVSSTTSNPDLVDLSKVNVILAPVGGGSVQSFTLQALVAANATGGLTINTPNQLNANSTTQYTLQVSMTSDAVSGSSATLGNIDFAFTGTVGSN